MHKRIINNCSSGLLPRLLKILYQPYQSTFRDYWGSPQRVLRGSIGFLHCLRLIKVMSWLPGSGEVRGDRLSSVIHKPNGQTHPDLFCIIGSVAAEVDKHAKCQPSDLNYVLRRWSYNLYLFFFFCYAQEPVISSEYCRTLSGVIWLCRWYGTPD